MAWHVSLSLLSLSTWHLGLPHCMAASGKLVLHSSLRLQVPRGDLVSWLEILSVLSATFYRSSKSLRRAQIQEAQMGEWHISIEKERVGSSHLGDKLPTTGPTHRGRAAVCFTSSPTFISPSALTVTAFCTEATASVTHWKARLTYLART